MSIDRRAFMRHSAVGLGAMSGFAAHATTQAASALPKRTKYLFVLEGNGLPQRQIHPSDVPFIPLEQRDVYREFKLDALPMALEPVADYLNQMCIVQGVSGRICGGGHSNDQGTLGSYNARDGKLIVGPTIDYMIGAQSDRIFDNVVLGINGNNLDIVFNCSAAGKDKPVATICNPVTAYNRLFGALGNHEAVTRDEKIIAYLKRDIQKTRTYLGDDVKLDRYDRAFDGILNRNAAIREKKGAVVPEMTDKYKSTDHVEMLDAHFEMAAAALKNDLTDSATLAVGVGYQHFQIMMNSLEGVTMPRHGLGHANMQHWHPDEPHPPHEEAALVRRYVFTLIARTLKTVDNLVVVYCSDAAEKHHSSGYEWPHVMISNNSNLRLDGRFIYYPHEGKAGHKTLNVLHNTLLRSAGIELEAFGQMSKSIDPVAQSGILSEIYS